MISYWVHLLLSFLVLPIFMFLILFFLLWMFLVLMLLFFLFLIFYVCVCFFYYLCFLCSCFLFFGFCVFLDFGFLTLLAFYFLMLTFIFLLVFLCVRKLCCEGIYLFHKVILCYFIINVVLLSFTWILFMALFMNCMEIVHGLCNYARPYRVISISWEAKNVNGDLY